MNIRKFKKLLKKKSKNLAEENVGKNTYKGKCRRFIKDKDYMEYETYDIYGQLILVSEFYYNQRRWKK